MEIHRGLPTDIDTIVSLAKRRGFVYPSSEIYGGQRAAWDYGPLGVELKNNIKRQWWRSMVRSRDDIVGLDSSVILAREVWEASGHVKEFVDPLTECQSCHKRFRADHLDRGVRGEARPAAGERPGRHRLPELRHPRRVHRAADVQRPAVDPPRRDRGRVGPGLPAAGDRAGHLHQLPQRAAVLAEEAAVRHRPDRQVVPQRDHPGQLHLPDPRVRADGDGVLRQARHRRGVARVLDRTSASRWYADLGIDPDNLRLYEHPKEKLSHYSKRTVDIEYRFRFSGTEWGELEGIANRTDFDLTTHSKHSGADLSYFDQEKGERWMPYVIEPAAGVDRPMMAFLLDAYAEDEAPNAKGGVEKRTVLRLDPRLAPVKAAVLPLSRNADLSPKARDLAAVLRQPWNVEFDDAGAIGRRYRRQDEIGTPFCLTVDFDTLDRPGGDGPGPRLDGSRSGSASTRSTALPGRAAARLLNRRRQARVAAARRRHVSGRGLAAPAGQDAPVRSPAVSGPRRWSWSASSTSSRPPFDPADGLLLLGAELGRQRGHLGAQALHLGGPLGQSPARRAFPLPGVLDAVRHDPVRPETRPATGSSLPAAPVHRRRGLPFYPLRVPPSPSE